MSQQLSPNFSLAELTVTDTGLPNVPAPLFAARLRDLAAFLEKVRAILGGHAVHVDSAFRSPRVNAAVGGVPDSAHALGYAADIVIPGFGDPFAVCEALDAAAKAGRLVFDQLIYEGTWTHISRDVRARGQRLTHVGGGYVDGLVR